MFTNTTLKALTTIDYVLIKAVSFIYIQLTFSLTQILHSIFFPKVFTCNTHAHMYACDSISGLYTYRLFDLA